MVYDFLNMCLIDMTKEKFYDDYDLAAIRIFGEGGYWNINISVHVFNYNWSFSSKEKKQKDGNKCRDPKISVSPRFSNKQYVVGHSLHVLHNKTSLYSRLLSFTSTMLGEILTCP